MTAIERTAYPRLKSRYSPKELDQLFTPTAEELVFIRQISSDSDHPQLGLCAQLKCFQHLGYFVAPERIPQAILHHLQTSTDLPPNSAGYRWQRTLYRHRRAIRRYLAVEPYQHTRQEQARQAIYAAAQTMGDPADLINAAIEELVRQRVELPAFRTLKHLVQKVRTEVNEGWYQQVSQRLSAAEQAVLLALPTRRDEQSATDFAVLKTPPGKPVFAKLQDTGENRT